MIEDCITTHEINVYESSSTSSVLLHFNKALDLSYKPGDNMSDHLGKLNGLVNQIRSAGDTSYMWCLCYNPSHTMKIGTLLLQT
jgi:hypothetical protein